MSIGKLILAAVLDSSALTVTTKHAVVEKRQNLNICTNASTESKIVGKYKVNHPVKVVQSYNKDYYQVIYNGKVGYVSSKYVDGTHDFMWNFLEIIVQMFIMRFYKK